MKHVVVKWRTIVYEQFYILSEHNVHDVLLSFDALASQSSQPGITTLIDNVQLVVVCSSFISLPKLTTKSDQRILRNTVPYTPIEAQSAPSLNNSLMLAPTLSSGSNTTGVSTGSITLLQPDTSYQDQYVHLLNVTFPYLASGSPYIISMALALIAKMAMHVSQEQILDVLTNVTNILEIFLNIGESGLLPACIASIVLENICCEAIEPGDSLHAGTVLSLRALLQGLRSSTKLVTLLTTEEDACGKISTVFSTTDERTIGLAFYQRLFSSAAAKLIRSPQLVSLPRVDDVDLLSSIVGDVYLVLSLLKPPAHRPDEGYRQGYDELAVTNILCACQCNTMVQLFLRVPSYLSGTLGLTASLLISEPSVRSSRVANACRGFLAITLLTNVFLSVGQATDDDVHSVISVLRSELTEDMKTHLKTIVESGYQKYLSNYGIPFRSARRLDIKPYV